MTSEGDGAATAPFLRAGHECGGSPACDPECFTYAGYMFILRFVAFFAIVPLLTVLVPADKARALDFSLQTIRAGNCGDSCPKVIVASGEIYIDDDMRLLRLFRATPDLQRVAPLMMINSPGGQAGGGFRLAHMVRALKITVAVASPIGETGYGPAHCHSACTLVLSGGVRRIVVPGAKLRSIGLPSRRRASIHKPAAIWRVAKSATPNSQPSSGAFSAAWA